MKKIERCPIHGPDLIVLPKTIGYTDCGSYCQELWIE